MRAMTITVMWRQITTLFFYGYGNPSEALPMASKTSCMIKMQGGQITAGRSTNAQVRHEY